MTFPISRTLAVVAITTLVVELAWVLFGWQVADGVTFPVLPSDLLAPVVFILAVRALPKQHARAWAGCWTVLGAATIVAAAAAVSVDGLVPTLELAVVAISEEAVWRFAIPVALATMARRAGVERKVAMRSAVGISAAVFVALPGHVAQMVELREVATFIAITAVLTMVVWTSGALVTVAAAHAAINMLAVAAGPVWPTAMHGVAIAIVLGSLVYGAHRQQLVATAEHPPVAP